MLSPALLNPASLEKKLLLAKVPTNVAHQIAHQIAYQMETPFLLTVPANVVLSQVLGTEILELVQLTIQSIVAQQTYQLDRAISA